MYIEHDDIRVFAFTVILVTWWFCCHMNLNNKIVYKVLKIIIGVWNIQDSIEFSENWLLNWIPFSLISPSFSHPLDQYGFLSYIVDEGRKLFFHSSQVKDKTPLQPGDLVEFVLVTNQRSGKSSAYNVSKIK